MKNLLAILIITALITSCGSSNEGTTDSPEALDEITETSEDENPDERYQTLDGIGYTETEMLYTPGGDFFLCGFMKDYQDNETTVILKDADGNQILIFTYDPHVVYSQDDFQCTEPFYISQGYFYFDIISKSWWVLTVAGNSWTDAQLNGLPDQI